MKRLVIDVDDTLTINASAESYDAKHPRAEVVAKLRDYKAAGFEIVLFSSRNMRSYDGNIGQINVATLPVLLDWLKRHDIPFDEVHVGKPWCGHQGFYVDDKAIRPDEFAEMSYDEICALLKIPGDA